MLKNIALAWLELARISNLPTVWTNVLAAWMLAGGKWEWKPLTALLVGGSLIYTGGMFLNDAADVKFDREHRRERPIPSGRISAAQAWIVGIFFLLGGFALFVRGAEACIWLTGALVAAILFYDLYHKQWLGSVFVMGSCRTLLFLASASAVTGTLGFSTHAVVLAKGVALGGYVSGISLAARGESKTAHLHPVLRVLGLIGLLLPVLMSVLFHLAWHLPVWMALVMGLVIYARKIMRTPPPSNIGRSVGLLLAGITWVDALAVSTVSPAASIGLTLVFPLLLLLQKKIAAT